MDITIEQRAKENASARCDGYYLIRFPRCADVWTIGQWRNYGDRGGQWQFGCPEGVHLFASDEAARFIEIGERLGNPK